MDWGCHLAKALILVFAFRLGWYIVDKLML